MADKKTSSLRDDKSPVKPALPRPDWEAVERDYRTGRFSLRELAVLHNANHATIGRRVEREGWTKDLTHAIRLATHAKLIEEETQQHCDGARQSATTVVLAAAETNRQIILGHRRQAVAARTAMETARAKLLALSDTVADIREAAVLVSATESLSRTSRIVIEMELQAFGLTDKAAEDDRLKQTNPSARYQMSDDDLVAEILASRAARREAA